MSLLVIGTLAYDTIETVNGRADGVLGGSATYFSIAASYFAPVRLVGVVGTDFAARDRELLRARGIDVSGIETAEGKSFRWTGRYEPDWNTRTTLDTQLNVFERFDPKIPPAHRASPFVFLANGAPSIQARALDQMTAPKFTMLDTMNLWIATAKHELLALLKRVDAVVVNDEEARMLTGEKSLIRAALRVLDLGPRYVLLKKGEHGAFLMGRDVHFSLPAYPVEDVVDPTGAGDSFAGGFMGYLAEQADTVPASLRRAMLYGTVTASMCVQGFSVDALKERTRQEIDARYRELLNIVTV
ncbi:MAG: PfkB family carbohydrate kinase [Planctomycetota bacterium]